LIAEALAQGWRALESAFWRLIFASVLLLVPDFVFGAARIVVDLGSSSLTTRSAFGIIAVAALTRLVARCMLRPGVLSLQLAVARRQPTALAMVFDSFDRTFSMIGAQFFTGLITMGCALFAALPGIAVSVIGHARGVGPSIMLAAIIPAVGGFLYASVNLLLTEWFIVNEGRSSFAAIKESWRSSRSWRLRLVGLYVLVGTIELTGLAVGILLCGVGMLVTVPFARAYSDAVLTNAYLQLRCPPPSETGPYPQAVSPYPV
jgi:hypothetical protein